jgi:hypothetical protein
MIEIEYLPLPQSENDFQAHADCLRDYQSIMVDNVAPTAPGAYNAPGTVVYGAFTPGAPAVNQGKVYNAIILPIQEHQLPRQSGGGLVPTLLCTCSVLKSDLPVATVFKTGQYIYVNPVWSYQRFCQIFSIEDCFTSWKLTVFDVSQNG